MNFTKINTLLWLTFGSSLFFFIFFSNDKSAETFLYNLLISAMYAFTLGIGNGFANDYLTKKYPWIDHTKKRTILAILVTLVLNVVIVYLCNYINFVWIQKISSTEEFLSGKHNVANWFIINFALMVSAFLHAKGFMEELKKNTKKEVVEQKLIANSVNAQLESLKNQLDPHFLFNSLNVLNALIDENPKQAQKFTTSMSKIYRYVLEQKDKELVSVEDEIEFARTYCNLLKTRFEDSINFEFDIQTDDLPKMIVPLSLQLLLENCIKHNFATSSKPLKIKIYTENNILCIENNLQFREQLKESAGIGLANIVQRYSLFSEENVFIEKSETNFKVKLPLLTEKKSQNMIAFAPENQEDLAYRKAVKRVKELKGFYGNLISYIIVIPCLVIINLIVSPNHLWFYWPMLGWGIGLTAHGMNVFAIGRNWEEKKIKEIMNNQK